MHLFKVDIFIGFFMPEQTLKSFCIFSKTLKMHA